MDINRRSFISLGTCAAAAAAAAPALGAATEKPILRLGILSDSQGYPYKEDWGFHNFERALEVLAKRGIDVLVNAGDIMDTPEDIEGLAYVQELEKKHFGAAKPVDIACLGNHEMGFAYAKNRAKADGNIRRYCEIYGYPVSPLVHKVVKGYDFIALTRYEDVGYDGAAIALLKGALDKAVARDAKKPIFVVTHFHPKDTVLCSSGGDGTDGAALRTLFDAYPQVVSLSGHCHGPLQDEKCIWQGSFTALETSTLSYGCMPVEYANACYCIIPWGRESVGFMTADVYADRIEIRRWQAEDQVEMKPACPWIVRTPYRPAEAVYTESRRKAAEVAPRFAAGTPLLARYDYGYVYFVFDQATHPDFVHHYRLALTEIGADGQPVGKTASWKYLGNFYRYARNRDRRLCIKVMPKAMRAGARYRVELYPVANFGTEGAPLAMDFQVRASYGFRNDPMAVPYPQE